MKQKQAYLIGVSGGADSMALLDMAYKKNINIQVAHVNYKKRDTANRDELCVKKYCEDRGIKFHTKSIKEYPKKGNFQEIAREMRYEFFKQLCDENSLDGVLIAHHADDFLETYLFKEKRKNFTRNYGIQFYNEIYGVKVYRPLLEYTKKELREYCIDQNVPFEDDESNFTDHYARNKIRHNIIDNMSVEEKKTLIKEANVKQEKQDANIAMVSKYIKNNIFDISKIEDFNLISLGIIVLLNNNGIYKISKNQLNEFERIYNEKEKFTFSIGDYDLILENKKIALISKDYKYEYLINSKEELILLNNELFDVKKTGKIIDGVYLKNDDFPIKIRNFNSGDKIHMRYGYKKVSRHCIDRKIPMYNRKNLLIIENRKGDIIFVETLGCDSNHYKENELIYIKSKINKI